MKALKSIVALALCAVLLTACSNGASKNTPGSSPDKASPSPAATEPLETPEVTATPNYGDAVPEPIQQEGEKEPVLKVYDTAQNQVVEQELEDYVAHVLAGEMKSDWPKEALKAQAILARTFVLYFVTEKESMYEGANISTDIKEAQAYNTEGIDENILAAVEETRGEVVLYNGKPINAWFHAHAGGKTAVSKEGLNYEGDEPPYIQSVDSPDSDKAPEEDASWTASFTKEEVLAALQSSGVSVQSVDAIEVGETGASGRAITLKIGEAAINAADFRIKLGSQKLKSTLLEDITVEAGKVIFTGRGYGHGVGMSQWGAYGMAEEGKTGEEIVQYYFKDVAIQKLWE